MEANPEAYGADFCTRLEQAAELVELVDSPGFKLHIDAGGLALSGEDFDPVIRQAAALIGHAHASQPNLVGWDDPHPVHRRLGTALSDCGYPGDLAIEMRVQEDVSQGVLNAIHAVKTCYQING
jgi:sugar phosphate isomerase/epimerase